MGDLEKWMLLKLVCQECVEKNSMLQVKGKTSWDLSERVKTRSDGEVCNMFSRDTIITICNFWARLTRHRFSACWGSETQEYTNI